MKKIDIYLSGKYLYGDDFKDKELEKWYIDEKEGFSELYAKDKATYKYVYHTLNKLYGFKYLSKQYYKNVLGLGSAFGDEFLPIISRIKYLTIVDPSDAYNGDHVYGIPCRYIKPSIDGILPFDNNTFDLICCHGVLHHIPNVSTVIKELARCLTNNGVILIREPIVSMGNWTKPRHGLTKRERGIPVDIFLNIIYNSELRVYHQSLCMFPIIPLVCNRFGILPYNSYIFTWIDKQLSRFFLWNLRYHPTSFFHKFRPTSIYFVLTKKY